MRTPIFSLFVVVLAGAALAAGYFLRTGGREAPAPEVHTLAKPRTDRSTGTPRPEFWLPDPGGVRHGIAEWDGKLLVLNFWATWCPPCLDEIPGFIVLQERYRDRGVQFLGVAIDDADKVRAFVSEVGLNYPTLHGQLEAIEVMTAYGNQSGGLPFTVVIDRKGDIVARHPGVLEEAAAVALIEELL